LNFGGCELANQLTNDERQGNRDQSGSLLWHGIIISAACGQRCRGRHEFPALRR
jgi:hypothetical protein